MKSTRAPATVREEDCPCTNGSHRDLCDNIKSYPAAEKRRCLRVKANYRYTVNLSAPAPSDAIYATINQHTVWKWLELVTHRPDREGEDSAQLVDRWSLLVADTYEPFFHWRMDRSGAMVTLPCLPPKRHHAKNAVRWMLRLIVFIASVRHIRRPTARVLISFVRGFVGGRGGRTVYTK